MKYALLCLFLLAGCVASGDDPRLGRAVSASAGEGGGSVSALCTSAHWDQGLCDLVAATPFAGVLTEAGASRTYPLGSNPWAPVPASYIVESGRLSASPYAGASTRLDMNDIRETFRRVCYFPDGTQVASPCGAMISYAYSGGGYLFLDIWGDPAAANTVMPFIQASYVYYPGGTVYDADAYALYWLTATPGAQRADHLTGAFAHVLSPNVAGATFSAAYPGWHSP